MLALGKEENSDERSQGSDEWPKNLTKSNLISLREKQRSHHTGRQDQEDDDQRMQRTESPVVEVMMRQHFKPDKDQ